MLKKCLSKVKAVHELKWEVIEGTRQSCKWAEEYYTAGDVTLSDITVYRRMILNRDMHQDPETAVGLREFPWQLLDCTKYASEIIKPKKKSKLT